MERTDLSVGASIGLVAGLVAAKAMVFTPPPTAYPRARHVRGLVGRLVLGLVLAAGAEAGWALAGGVLERHEDQLR